MLITINKKSYDSDDYTGKTDLLLENICYELLNDDRFNFMDRLKFVFNFLVNYTNKIINNVFTPPYNFDDVKTDRDKLELVIEQYKFTKYLTSGDKRHYTEYLEELEEYEVFSKDKAIMTLIDYKLARFGNDIFEEMGIEIIDRIDKGFIVRDIGEYKN